MKVIEVYSHLNGLEFLRVHKESLWKELQNVIEEVDADKCKTKVSKEETMKGPLLYSPIEMNNNFKRLLKAKNWGKKRVDFWLTKDEKLIRKTLYLSPEEQKKEIEAHGFTPLPSYNTLDYIKDRVAVQAQFGIYSFVAYNLFVKHLVFYLGDKIDVGIEIMPMKSLQNQMDPEVPYYENELYNVIRQGRGVPAVPLVIIGINP